VELLVSQEVIPAISLKYFFEEIIRLFPFPQNQYIQQYINSLFLSFSTMIIDILGIGFRISIFDEKGG